jgi:hypothetical protein
VHAQGKISGACFFCGNFFATLRHLMFHGAPVVLENAMRNEAKRGSAATAAPQKNAARQNRAKRFAFGLPQDLHMQLMFEPCVKRGSRLSAFRGVGFHVERRAAAAARRPRTRRKRLNERPNFLGRTAAARAKPLKRFHRHGFPHHTMRCKAENSRRLPSVRHNVPKVCRKTHDAR